MKYVGMQTQISRNNTLSLLLLLLFPIIILGMVWVFLAVVNYFGNGYYDVNGEFHRQLDPVAIEVQFGKYSFVAYDVFVKHLAFYVGDKIDVGIEILPMKTLQSEMSSGVSYYEGELYNVVRQGRGVPAVPLIIIGIEPWNILGQ